MSDETVIKKIPLDKLIAALVSLYNGGVDFIDIVAEKGKIQDKMQIEYGIEYMNKEAAKAMKEEEDEEEEDEDYEEEEEEIVEEKPLTDEDLNQLI
jgi:hypothetical protein